VLSIALASLLATTFVVYRLKLEFTAGLGAAMVIFVLYSVYGRATLNKRRCPACRARWLARTAHRCSVCGIPWGMFKSAFDEAQKNAAARATED
jgi:hypothetical protein